MLAVDHPDEAFASAMKLLAESRNSLRVQTELQKQS